MKNFLSLILILIIGKSFGQIIFHTNDITVRGITTELISDQFTSKINDVDIRIYEYNEEITTYCTDKHGRFEFTIPKNTYIMVVFEKANFLSKRILFDTRDKVVVERVRPFNMEIVMINYAKGPEFSILDFPITRIEYQEKLHDYDYAKDYTKTMIAKQEKAINIIKNK